MRETLNDYKNIQEQTSAIPLLAEDVYFETRLFEQLKGQSKPKAFWTGLQKPAIAFSAICVVLMGIFYFKPDALKTIVNESSSIATLTKNLKPLLFAANLNKEDMFNFAFNKIIPVNKEEKQFLQFGADKNGQGVIEVKYADAGTSKLSYKCFVNSLDLKPNQVKEMDQILDKYSEKISEVVLVNDKNVVAVNSQIWNYQNQLRKELIEYAAGANPGVMKNINPKMKLGRNTDMPAPDGDASNFYYCFSADSFFTAPLNVDKGEIKKAIETHKKNLTIVQGQLAELPKKIKIQIKTALKNANIASSAGNNLHVISSGNNVRVLIPQIDAPEAFMADFDVMNGQLDEAFDNMREFSVDVNIGADNGNRLVTVQAGGDVDRTTIEKPSKTYIRGHGHNLDSLRARTTPDRKFSNVQVHIDLDSLMQAIRRHSDSLVVGSPSELKNGLQKFKKELMDNINRELQQFKKEQRNQDSTKKQIEVEPIEL